MVKLRSAIGLGKTPVRPEEPLEFKAMERRIDGSLFHTEEFAGGRPDALHDRVAMSRACLECREDQEIECAGK